MYKMLFITKWNYFNAIHRSVKMKCIEYTISKNRSTFDRDLYMESDQNETFSMQYIWTTDIVYGEKTLQVIDTGAQANNAEMNHFECIRLESFLVEYLSYCFHISAIRSSQLHHGRWAIIMDLTLYNFSKTNDLSF